MGEGEGPKGKTTLLPPLSRGQNRGGGRGRRRRPAPASQGAAAAGRRGERERGSRGFDSPSYLEPGWSVEAARLRRAASGSGTRGGGVGEQGGALVVAEVAVGRRSGAGGLFIGRMRRWSGAGQVVAAGERRGEP